MKKVLQIVRMILLVVCVTACMAGCSCQGSTVDSKQEEMDWQNQYDLGIRLLSEGKYEEAIVAFQAAIQIDPKKADAYVGLADVYIAMEDGQAAADILLDGLEAVEEKSGRETLEKKLEEVKEVFPGVDTDRQEGADGSNTGNDPASDAVIVSMGEYIAAQYDYAGDFHEGYAVVGYLQDDGSMKYCYIDAEGQIISALYDYAGDFHEGMAAVGMRVGIGGAEAWYSWMNCYLYGYINTQGEEVIPLQYLSDDEILGGRAFYDGLAEVCWFSEELDYYIETNLIDKEGNKVLPVDIVMRDERGYGWNPPDDPRLLSLISTDQSDDYACWNPVQVARWKGTNTFPVQVYDGTDTHWIDENLSIVKTTEGYVTELYGMDGWYVVYENYDFYDATGSVINPDGQVILTGVSSCEGMHGEYLYACYYTPNEDPNIISGAYSYVMYDLTGQEVAMTYSNLTATEDGYIVRGDVDETGATSYTVLDQEFHEIFSVKGNNVTQEWDYTYVDSEWVGHTLPVYTVNYYDEVTGMYQNVYLDLQGNEIIPRVTGTTQQLLNGKYIVCSASDLVEVYSLTGQKLLSLDGVSGLYNAYMTSSDLEVYYTYTEDGTTTYYTAEGTEDSLVLTEVEAYYDDTELLVIVGQEGEEEVLLSNVQSAVWGFLTDWDTAVMLKQGTVAVTEAPALSLIGNNLYKKAESITWDNMAYAYDVTDVSLHTVDGSWNSKVYMQMGKLSENYISFCENGKWGYLRVE